MSEILFKILEHGLSIWDSKEGKALYESYMENKKAHDVQMDKRAKGFRYSQFAVDCSLRNIADIAKSYYQFITANK